jgi:hypothetical protein
VILKLREQNRSFFFKNNNEEIAGQGVNSECSKKAQMGKICYNFAPTK